MRKILRSTNWTVPRRMPAKRPSHKIHLFWDSGWDAMDAATHGFLGMSYILATTALEQCNFVPIVLTFNFGESWSGPFVTTMRQHKSTYISKRSEGEESETGKLACVPRVPVGGEILTLEEWKQQVKILCLS